MSILYAISVFFGLIPADCPSELQSNLTLPGFPCITNTFVCFHSFVMYLSKPRRCAVLSIAKTWVVLIIVFSCSLAVAADAPVSKLQIQGGNMRIEFDNRLRSRVVARFDNKETVMGPFAS